MRLPLRAAPGRHEFGDRLAPLTITNPEVVALSGEPVHMIACRTGDPDDRIEGVVFAITPAELAATVKRDMTRMGRVIREAGIRAD